MHTAKSGETRTDLNPRTLDLDRVDNLTAETDARLEHWIAACWRRRGPLLFFVDVLTVCSSFMLAYYIRFYAEFLAIKSVTVAEVESYMKGAVVLAAVWVFFIWRDGGYETGFRGMGAPMLRIRALFMSGVYALAVLMVISYMYRGLLLSRQVYLMTGVLCCGTMILVRLLFRAVDRDLARLGFAAQRVLVTGTGRQAVDFIKRVDSDHGPIRVVGVLRWDARERNEPPGFAGSPVLGDLADIRAIHEKTPFDTLVISSDDHNDHAVTSSGDHMLEIINFCEEKRIPFYMLPKSFDVVVSQREVASFSGVAMIRLQDASLHPIYAAVKRLFDVCLSTAGIVLGMPLWLAIAVAIKATSKGPVFFIQTRAGLHGRPFKMCKFRSMVADAEDKLRELVNVSDLDEPVFKIRNDPRVTWIGAILRRTSLDEIPQLLNVTKGDMSLVGPRPEELKIVGLYNSWQRRRLKAKPGITGYQQISNRGETSLAERVKYDLIYLKHQSFFLDVYILLKTLVVVVRGAGVTH